jgi:hypothetical protein
MSFFNLRRCHFQEMSSFMGVLFALRLVAKATFWNQ